MKLIIKIHIAYSYIFKINIFIGYDRDQWNDKLSNFHHLTISWSRSEYGSKPNKQFKNSSSVVSQKHLTTIFVTNSLQWQMCLFAIHLLKEL